MTNFIATDTDHSAIYGIGTTEEAAIADALSQCRDLTGLIAVEASAELVETVRVDGGNLSWDMVDGVAVLD